MASASNIANGFSLIFALL